MGHKVRFAFLTAVLMLAAGAAFAAGGTQWDWMKDTSPFSFGMWWADIWPWAKPAAKWDDTPVCKLVEKKTGVSITYDVPVGKQDDLLGPMIASGDLPETIVISPYTSPYVNQMIDEGMVYNLTELMTKYAPKLKDLMSATLKVYHTSKDGNLYKWVSFITDKEASDA